MEMVVILWEGGIYDLDGLLEEFLELLSKFYFLIWVAEEQRGY